MTVPVVDIITACTDDELFSGWFRDAATWRSWFTFLKVLFGLPMSEAEWELFRQCTGRDDRPVVGFTEAWLVVGRRGGKSLMLALIAVFLAAFCDWSPYLAPGERATVMVIATDRRQARAIFRYARAFLSRVPLLASLIERETADVLDLSNNISVEIQTASFRSVRGYTLVAGLADELAFWPSEESSASPDVETIAALRPAMATIRGARLLCASTPYARRGALWNAYKHHYGKASAALVWKADTRTMNPTIPMEVITEAEEEDPVNAAAEFGAEFRNDVAGFIDFVVVEAAIDYGVTIRPPQPNVQYRSGCDPSGGQHNSFTLAVCHDEGNLSLLDCLVEIRSPFNPDEATKQIADVLRSYGLTSTVGDKYAARWVTGAFARESIEYVHADIDRSTAYLNLLPRFMSGQVRSLENRRLVSQFVALERRTSPGGRDRVDDGPNGFDDCANAVAVALVAAEADDFVAEFTRAWLPGKPSRFEEEQERRRLAEQQRLAAERALARGVLKPWDRYFTDVFTTAASVSPRRGASDLCVGRECSWWSGNAS